MWVLSSEMQPPAQWLAFASARICTRPAQPAPSGYARGLAAEFGHGQWCTGPWSLAPAAAAAPAMKAMKKAMKAVNAVKAMKKAMKAKARLGLKAMAAMKK